MKSYRFASDGPILATYRMHVPIYPQTVPKALGQVTAMSLSSLPGGYSPGKMTVPTMGSFHYPSVTLTTCFIHLCSSLRYFESLCSFLCLSTLYHGLCSLSLAFFPLFAFLCVLSFAFFPLRLFSCCLLFAFFHMSSFICSMCVAFFHVFVFLDLIVVASPLCVLSVASFPVCSFVRVIHSI